MPVVIRQYTIKSCGERHAWCGTCRPEIGEARRGYMHTSETRVKMSTAARNRSPEHRARISAAGRGRRHTLEARAKMSKIHRGRALSSEHRRALSESQRGRVFSDEHRAKLREARNTPAAKARARENALGRRHSLEARAKMSEARKRHIERCDGTCGSPSCMWMRTSSGLALDLAGVLIDHGYDLIPEVRFGPYSVDFYEPELHIAFEADGQYWHQRPEAVEHDIKRDAYLLAEHNLPVWRFAEGVINKMIEEA